MKIKLRTVFLKSIPYLMSIAGGIVLYTAAIDNAPNPNIRDLIINVSASLLSIPLVFLLYDYTNSRVARQMKKSMAHSLTDKLNHIMLNIVLLLRESMGVRSRLTLENLNRMLTMRSPEISRRLNIGPRILNHMNDVHGELDTLLYRNGQDQILTPDQTQILSSLARDLGHLITELKFHHGRQISAKYMEKIMLHVLDWLDVDSVSAITLVQHLTTAQPSGQGTKNKK